MKKFKKWLIFSCYFLGMIMVLVGISLSIALASSDTSEVVDNINLEKNVDALELKKIYKELKSKSLKPVMYDSMQEAVDNAKYFETSFVGKLTHYGPDCELCGGTLGCNRQNVKNGNIYYEDEEYGTLRIVAASKILPCGSIIRINVDAYDPNGMYVIVLDRGVSPGIIDLLKTSEKAWAPSRTVNKAVFDIVRYGY